MKKEIKKQTQKTVKVSVETHEGLRVLAFKKDVKINKLVEILLREYVQK